MRGLKKVLSIVVATVLICMSMPMMAYADATQLSKTFSDFPNDWSTPGLVSAVDNGLLTGFNGKIMPNDFLTRAQMAAILNSAFGAVKKGSLSAYTDLPSNQWFYPEFAKAVAMGSFVGTGDKMNPERFITREEVFVVIAKLWDLKDELPSNLAKFPDAGEVSSWAKPLLSAMAKYKYANGSNGLLKPQSNMTRAEFAALMNNLIVRYIRTADTYTGAVNGTLMVTAAGTILKDMIIEGDLIIGDGVGDGEVTLENVIVKGRTIVRGSALLVEGELLVDENVALGGALPQGGDDTNPPTPPTPPTPSSNYGFILINGPVEILVQRKILNDNSIVNFEMVSDVYNLSGGFLLELEKRAGFISRALAKNSANSDKPFAYTLANRIVNYNGTTPLKAFNNASGIFEAILVSGNATPEQVKNVASIILNNSLDDVITDLELLYPNSKDYVPEAFTISYNNGSGLTPQTNLLIKDIRSTFGSLFSTKTINSLVGSRVMSIQFGNEIVYLEIVKLLNSEI